MSLPAAVSIATIYSTIMKVPEGTDAASSCVDVFARIGHTVWKMEMR